MLLNLNVQMPQNIVNIFCLSFTKTTKPQERPLMLHNQREEQFKDNGIIEIAMSVWQRSHIKY